MRHYTRNAIRGDTKYCPDCKDFKDVSEFRHDKSHKDGLSTYCKSHATARSRRSMDKQGLVKLCPRCKLRPRAVYCNSTHPYCRECIAEVNKATYDARQARDTALRYNHNGFTLADYEAMLERQGGVCAICHQPETTIHYGKVAPLAVDHDHATGQVRALLCGRCNRLLGHLEQSIDTLDSMIEYLERYKTGEPIEYTTIVQ